MLFGCVLIVLNSKGGAFLKYFNSYMEAVVQVYKKDFPGLDISRFPNYKGNHICSESVFIPPPHVQLCLFVLFVNSSDDILLFVTVTA